jgi:UDP:flavonoid glycosyltransferase YjiC (YdhE family)
VQLIDPIPYAWLLPRVAGAVHHGGQGTVAAAARAGVPSVALPGVVDHHFWGRRLADAGLGPAPLSARRLSAERLQALLAALTSGRFDARARELGARIRAEDGVARAVELIENHAREQRRGA